MTTAKVQFATSATRPVTETNETGVELTSLSINSITVLTDSVVEASEVVTTEVKAWGADPSNLVHFTDTTLEAFKGEEKAIKVIIVVFEPKLKEIAVSQEKGDSMAVVETSKNRSTWQAETKVVVLIAGCGDNFTASDNQDRYLELEAYSAVIGIKPLGSRQLRGPGGSPY